METTKSEQGLAVVIFALRSDQMVDGENCTTAHDAWLKLQRIYG